ncbi:ankyrin repeat-containing domain protein [Phyllosticta citribraziliensis]
MTAVGRGDSHEVDRFLDAGANIDQIPLHPGKCGCTPLVSAFENGHPDMARLLICRGASLNFQTCGNAKAPFLKVTHLAALAPQFNGVLSLLLCQNSVSLQLDNDTPIHPLHVAVATCNEPGQKILLDHIQKSTPNAEHSHTRSIESGVPLSQTSDKCLSCSIINVQARASYRCNDPSFTIDRGYTPLLIAASESCYFCVELLLKYGADSNFPEYFVPPLHHAIWSGSQDITRLLLEHGANPNSRTSNMETAAIIALCRGSLEHLELLEEFGADCTLSNWKDRRKLSAMLTNTGKLMIPELTVFLLERGYPLQNISRLFVVSAKDAPDNQPRKSRSLTQEYSPGSSGSSLNQDAIFYQLDDLMLSGSLFEIKRALKYESKDPGTKRKFEIQGPQQKISRLCQASLGKCIDDIDLLLKYGTDIDEEGCPDGSALMAACSAGRIDSVQFLVRRGAKLTYPNGLRFRSALTAAEGHPGIQHWLLVERHTQQFKIKDARAGELEADSRSMKPWAGLEEVRIPWKGRFQRYSEESSFEHFLRLREIRGKLQGQVISWTTDPPDIFLAW